MTLLKPLELAYRGAAGLRRRLHRIGWLRSKRLPRPVISVGNIAFGGSGKTPVVIALARHLRGRGYRVAVLTRGYGRRSGGAGLVTSEDPRSFGDEPVLIARSVPQTDVIVGANRFACAAEFLRSHDCDLFLLDDGFQHLQLQRDLDVVIDRPGAPLLREGRSALREADIVLVRDHASRGEFQLEIAPVSVIRDGGEEPVETLRRRRGLIFAGLADNRQFFDMCRRLGLDVVAERAFRDHHRYGTSELEELRAAARAANALLLTTEKDFVKIRDERIAYLRVEARITPEQPFFDRVHAAIRTAAR